MAKTLIAWMAAMGLAILILSAALAPKAEAATASCYGPGLWHNRMADGGILYPHTIALAHKTLPLGTRLMVISPSSSRARMMIVRDRGPYVRGRQLDITQAGVNKLGISTCRSWGHRTVRTWRYPYRGG